MAILPSRSLPALPTERLVEVMVWRIGCQMFDVSVSEVVDGIAKGLSVLQLRTIGINWDSGAVFSM